MDIDYKALDKSDFVPARGGVDEFGLYVELLTFKRVALHLDPVASSWQFDAHTKLYLFENSVSTYTRDSAKKAGRWRVEFRADGEAARALFMNRVTTRERLNGRQVLLRHQPLLVQATSVDLIAVRDRLKTGPDSRWRAANRIESILGKLGDTADFDDAVAAHDAIVKTYVANSWITS